MALGINCKNFDFLDQPSNTDIDNAIKQLHSLGAVKTNGNCDELTQLGRNMAKFPLDPKFSKILLSAPEFQCLEEVS